MTIPTASRAPGGVAIALGAVMLVAATHALAQRWYTVEMIVFERLGDAGVYDEFWSESPGEPPVENSIELLDASELGLSEALDDEPAASSPHAFQRLAPDLFQLAGVWTQLRRSRDYRPLLHLAWHQPGYSKRRARPAHIRSWTEPDVSQSADALVESSGAYRPVIEGTLEVYRGKYLHVNADLLYYRDHALGLSSATGTVAGSGETDGRTEYAGPPAMFRLTASRRMRSRELHYLDHPVFGLLVRVVPYVAPQSEASQENE